MAGRVSGLQSFDKAVTEPRSISIEADANAVDNASIRAELLVPTNVMPFSSIVTDSTVAISFDTAERVEVRNAPLSPSARSDMSVWFVKADSTLVGPYVLSAYAKKPLALKDGIIGVELLSDATGTNATVEAFVV